MSEHLRIHAISSTYIRLELSKLKASAVKLDDVLPLGRGSMLIRRRWGLNGGRRLPLKDAFSTTAPSLRHSKKSPNLT